MVESADDPETCLPEGNTLKPTEQEFIGNLRFHGIEDLVKSLKMVHDFALYHTDLCFDREEKIALFNLKYLWEELERT
ncbi:MAG: hypothetical protein WBA74_09920 [Cyclobacteriaceae bacterium]